MAISNNNTGLRPGVCTSSTRPTSPYNGQVIYETDTKQTLVWQGSSWVMLTDADTPPGLELVKTQTIGSGVASVTVTNAFSAGWDNYKVTLSGGTGSVAQGIALQFGPSSVSGYNSGYYHALFYVSYGGGTTALNYSNISNISLVGESADNQIIDVDIWSPYQAKYASWGGFYPGTVAGWISGRHASTGQFTDFTLSVSGTMTGGTIRVYGYRNSI